MIERATLSRNSSPSTCSYVAARSLTWENERIVRGATRLAAGHRWLALLPSGTFVPVNSDAGRDAVRSLHDEGSGLWGNDKPSRLEKRPASWRL